MERNMFFYILLAFWKVLLVIISHNCSILIMLSKRCDNERTRLHDSSHRHIHFLDTRQAGATVTFCSRQFLQFFMPPCKIFTNFLKGFLTSPEDLSQGSQMFFQHSLTIVPLARSSTPFLRLLQDRPNPLPPLPHQSWQVAADFFSPLWNKSGVKRF